jgi:hypothetical protein
MARTTRELFRVLGCAVPFLWALPEFGQAAGPLGYSVATPRPISPAEGTTTPSAQAAQKQNPYLGSVPVRNTRTRIELSLSAAIERGLRYNLGLVETNQASADVHAERLRALSALLPSSRRTPAKPTKASARRRSASSFRRSPVSQDCRRPPADSDIRMCESP